MDHTTAWLTSAIGEFIAVLERCLAETTYLDDRRLYTDDLATAKAWLARLGTGDPPTAIAAEILAPATAKQFTDYWRKGVWGDMQSAGLNTLQTLIRREIAAEKSK
jgi:hypothetical protein